MMDAAPGIDKARISRLLFRLLDIYSPSGKEEEVVDFLAGYLRRRGLPVIRQEVDDRRANLVSAQAGDNTTLAFIGHVDTVSAYDLEDFGHQRDGDTIKGLGAADMKGGCAALIEAYVRLWEIYGSDLNLALALVVGEEEEGDGAEVLTGEYRFPWAVIAEPTGLRPCLDHYGYVAVQVQTQGRRRHASLARDGRNAVQDMLKVLLRLTDYLDQTRPELVYNVRDLFSSGGGFVVPEGCEAWLDVHLPPEAPAGEITVEFDEILAAEKAAHPELEAILHFDTVHPGYSLPEKGPVVTALRGAFEEKGLAWNPEAFPSHSDANLLFSAGVRPIMFGPGRIENAHRPDEEVSLAEVFTAAEVFLAAGRRLMTRDV